jgi:galactose mutarotase-like enzyme
MSFASAPVAPSPKKEQAFLRREPWGTVGPDKIPIERITFGDVTGTSGHGLQVSVLTYGAIVQSVRHRRAGDQHPFEEITLGFDKLDDYVNDQNYIGATVGRYANRIRDGYFTVPSTEMTDEPVACSTTANDGAHTLHGGAEGFNKRIWRVKRVITPDAMEDRCIGVVLSLISPDGDEGFPGEIEVEAVYLVKIMYGELHMRFRAALTPGQQKCTVVSLTNHNYWNLTGGIEHPPSSPHGHQLGHSGHGTHFQRGHLGPNDGLSISLHSTNSPSTNGGSAKASPAPGGDFTSPAQPAPGPHAVPSIDGHGVVLKSDFVLSTSDGEIVPDGGVVPLRGGSCFEHPSTGVLRGETKFATVNSLLEGEMNMSSTAGSVISGLDHCFVVRGTANVLRPAARVWDPKSGRMARVRTTLPGMQVYTGNFLPDKTVGRNGAIFGYRSGFCIEPGMFPDAPNHPHFPSALLRPGETWDHLTVWSFD